MAIGILKKHNESPYKVVVEWRIKKFLPYLDKFFNFRSPFFAWSNIMWVLDMEYSGTDDIRLFLCTKSGENKAVMFKFAIQLRDGTTEKRCRLIKTFRELDGSFGTREFLCKSEVVKRKHSLLPGGTLTIFCTMTSRDHEIGSQVPRYESFNVLSSKLKSVYESGEHSDVTIVIGEQKFPAHKFILAARSEVFAAMFRHDMEEANSGIVNATDCEPTSFKDFLLFLYTGKAENISHSNVYDLYKTADKYNVQDLKYLCIKYIKVNLSIASLLDVVIFANIFKETDLAAYAQNFFNLNALEIMTKNDWEYYLKHNFSIINQLTINLVMNMEGEK